MRDATAGELTREQKLDRFVDQNVFYNQNMLISDMLTEKPDLWGEVQNLVDAEDEPQEIFSWYLVSDFLADALRTHGEPVLQLGQGYGSFWGRTTFGQMISMDSAISDIYDSL